MLEYNNKSFYLIKILESWSITENPMNSTDKLLEWIKTENKKAKVKIKKIQYDYSGFWYYEKTSGEIKNRSNSFFQIKGIIEKNDRGRVVKEQPIIIQNEIGYLGIIGKIIDGVLYFLMQAKIEPGNINKVQISPTIQATKSNFMQAHGGMLPAYLEYFSGKMEYEVIVDQIQSEQSSRFYKKRNRNIIIIIDDDIEVLDTHKWMTLGQIKQLMQYNNLVNMDSRTVISCIPFSLHNYTWNELNQIKKFFKNEEFYNSIFKGNSGLYINKIFRYINEVKMFNRSSIELIDLYSLETWKMQNGEFLNDTGAFKIIYCDIEINGREVNKWQQPLFEANRQLVFGLIYCIEENVKKFLICTRTEIGCFDKIEVGPSVQLDFNDNQKVTVVDNVFISNLKNNKKGVEFDGIFSEEGGRFYHEQNRNIIMRVDIDELPKILPEGYFWVDFQTLNVLIQFNNCLNIQLRNLLSILDL